MPSVSYSARLADGADVHGRLAARTLEDARRILEARGLRDVAFRTDPVVGIDPPDGEETTVAPSGPGVAFARSFASHWFVWAAVAWALWYAHRHGGLAWAGAVSLALLAAGYWLLLALPILAYQRLQDAKSRRAWPEAQRMIAFLRLANAIVLRRADLARAFDDDELRIWAATGRFDEACARANARPRSGPSDEAAHHGLLLGLCDYAGRPADGREHAREAARLCPDVGAHWSELAMQEARFGTVEAAYEALARAATLERSAIAHRHERIALAWIALRDGDAMLALPETTQVLADLADPTQTTTPGYLAFARAVHAWALACAGRPDEAERFFLRASRRLGPSEADLVDRVERAIAGAKH